MERLIEDTSVFEGGVSGAEEHFHLLARAGAGVAIHYLLGLASGAGYGAGDRAGDLFIARNAGNWCR